MASKRCQSDLLPSFGLTIRQPWAQAIAVGLKKIENRSWRPSAGRLPMRIAIHAGRAVDRRGLDFCADLGLLFRREDLPTSCVVAVATVTHVMDGSSDPWWIGPLGWCLEDVRVLQKPVPCPGKLSLWSLPDKVRLAVAKGLGR